MNQPANREELLRTFRLELVKDAGGYLRNIIREPQRTCQVCCTPVQDYPRCMQCNYQLREFGSRLADLVAPLTYAMAGSQSGHVMRAYKDSPSVTTRQDLSKVVALILFYGLVKHERCAAAQLGMPVHVRLTVPSLGKRLGVHPLTRIADDMGATSDECRLEVLPAATSGRQVSPTQFYLTPGDAVRGRHVLVIDDTWTSGANGQSAALTLRNAGAARITIIPICRWLNPSYEPTGPFIRTRLTADYEPDQCPVTGSRCPE